MDKKQKPLKGIPGNTQKSQPKVQLTKRTPDPREVVAHKPITFSREAIARRAYEIYVSRGPHEGSAEQDWAQAEKELTATAKRSG